MGFFIIALGIKTNCCSLPSILFNNLSRTMLVYFYNIISIKRPDTTYPFFIVLLWAISNASNSIISLNMYIIIIVAIVCGSYMSILGEKKEPYLENNRV